MEQRPTYGAGFALDITLGTMLETPIYLHQKPDAELVDVRQSEPCRVVLISECSTPQALKDSIAKELVHGSCLYLMAWGTECEAWHDAVDMANIEKFDFQEIPEEQFIMTTWHDNEPLVEAFWFCKNNATHSTAEFRHTVLLHVSPEAREQQVLAQYAGA